jgi:transposase-like protein
MEQSLQTLTANHRLTEWGERIAACRNSGLSVRAWCREHEISEKTYFYWQRRVYQTLSAQQEPYFAEVPVTKRSGPQAILATLRIDCIEADIYAGADAATIEIICRALKSC